MDKATQSYIKEIIKELEEENLAVFCGAGLARGGRRFPFMGVSGIPTIARPRTFPSPIGIIGCPSFSGTRRATGRTSKPWRRPAGTPW